MNNTTYPIHQVKNESHSNTEFLKVQFTITIHIRQIPDFLELFITKPTVPEHRGRLGAVQMRLAIRQGCEDLPVPFDFPLFNLLIRHGGCEERGEGEVLLLCRR